MGIFLNKSKLFGKPLRWYHNYVL